MNCPLSALFTVMSLSIEQYYIEISCVSIALTMHDVSLCLYLPSSVLLCHSLSCCYHPHLFLNSKQCPTLYPCVYSSFASSCMLYFCHISFCLYLPFPHPPSSPLPQAYVSILFLLAYVVESGMRIVAYGLIFHPKAYLRSSINILDLFPILFGYTVPPTLTSIVNPSLNPLYERKTPFAQEQL